VAAQRVRHGAVPGRLALAKLLGEVCLDRVQSRAEDDELFPDWLTAD